MPEFSPYEDGDNIMRLRRFAQSEPMKVRTSENDDDLTQRDRTESCCDKFKADLAAATLTERISMLLDMSLGAVKRGGRGGPGEDVYMGDFGNFMDCRELVEAINNVLTYETDDPADQDSLDQLRQIVLEYESCKGVQFGNFTHDMMQLSENTFEAAWDSIFKMPTDFDPFPDVSPEQARAIFAQMMTTSALDNVDTMPEVKVGDAGGDKCCAEAKSKWITYLTEQFDAENEMMGDKQSHRELSDSIIAKYEAMDCDEFKMFLENIAGVNNNHPVYRAHNERKGLGRTTESYEAARIMESWNACEFGAGENAEDMGFYASDDSFEATWDSISKAPLDMDSIKPVAYVPNNDDEKRFSIADFIHPKTGKRYPMVMTTPSYSHDFNVDIEYPPDEQTQFDEMLGHKIGSSNVSYHLDHEPDDLPFAMNYPIEGATVNISPYIADNFRNLGMAQAIYDLIDALGYRVKASDTRSDEGDAFWSANQGRTVDSYEMPFWRNKETRENL
tara:strand:- start:22179 stop:23687 length:1509 start_codon:yes stop_codon:yes gene_type:complete